ncbi:MAG TPA: methionine synthase [Longimicrobium sp.]|jgi:5-methyltetrahydrofolate--homocysteine methyltransferase|uniref:methionine synthase n=1 Tax=Longimicrobium sp. TaxID=2029185 RepID=UPI002ED8213B
MERSPYLAALDERVLVFDGAMGTSVQRYDLTAEDFGGAALEGCNDYLVITRPDVIGEIHASFLAAGADVLETDTFRSNRLTLREYGLQDRVREINVAAARLARGVADRFAAEDGKPRFVAGSIGPSGFLPSASDPTLGNITFGELVPVFAEQGAALIEGGADVLLIETSQDILEVKAAVFGCRQAIAESGRPVALQVQVTLDTSGRMLLGTDIGAAMVTLESLRADVIGLNCSTGPEHMRQAIRYLGEHSRLPISCIPNAGIPHNEGGCAVYPLESVPFADQLEEFVREHGVRVVGGCCGTTPEHIRELVGRLSTVELKPRNVEYVPRLSSGIRATDLIQVPAPTMIGERVNAQGSRKVKRLLLADDYDGVLEVAREQTENGAHVLDVCVALTERQDEGDQMRSVVKLLSQGVEAPLCIDSTEADVIRVALEQSPGRALVNSINLENGRERIDAVLPLVAAHGAAVIALTIDRDLGGMCKTAETKLQAARKIHDIAVHEYGLQPDALIFDALTFTLATGDEEFRTSAAETIEGIRAIKRELPGVLTTLGVSNVSFGLSPAARAVLNSVFLHHCVNAGLDTGIINPSHVTPYFEIPEEERRLADDLIFDRRTADKDPLADFIAFYEGRSGEAENTSVDPTATMTPEEALHWKILHRKKDGVEEWIDRAVEKLGAVPVLNEVLLPAMKEVGDKFGAGELILPFVLQSAEVMKKAVARLENYLEKAEGQTKGKVVLATVYGDVHDIGKSLVNTILTNNGYTVFDLGKQVPVNTILEKAEEVGADAIGLSALLVSTSKQMPLCAQELHRRGLKYPILVGGAAINPSFVRSAAMVAEAQPYPSGMFYCKDAFEGLATMDRLMADDGAAFIEQHNAEMLRRTAEYEARKASAKGMRPGSRENPAVAPADVPTPPFWGWKVLDHIPVDEVVECIDRNTLYRMQWGARNLKGEEWERIVREDFEPRLARYTREARTQAWLRPRGIYGYFPAGRDGDDVVVFDPSDRATEIGRFTFPRQEDREELCLADYFRPLDGEGPRDVLPLQVVTSGDRAAEFIERRTKGGDYSEGYFLHGFSVQTAEGAAEFINRRIRQELGIGEPRGLRYSWGYPACPDVEQHEVLFKVLPIKETIGVGLTAGYQLDPEQSTAALVVHHPAAKYFAT